MVTPTLHPSYLPSVLDPWQPPKDVLRVYVEFGANLEAQDNGKLTPLLWAAVNGNEDVVRFLVVNGANIQAKDEDGMTALGLATVLKRQTVRDFLTEAGAGKKTA